MTANTPTGWPYPVGTDRVMDGDDRIHDLASMLDTRLGRGWAAGTVSVPTTTAGTPATVAVTFPVGVFTQPPIVALTIQHNNTNQMYPPTIAALSATGVTVSGCRQSGTAAITVHWLALQLAP